MSRTVEGELAEAIHRAFEAAMDDQADRIGEAMETIVRYGPRGVHIATHAWTTITAQRAPGKPHGHFWGVSVVSDKGVSSLNESSFTPAQQDAIRMVALLKNGDLDTEVAIVKNYWAGGNAELSQFLVAVLALATQESQGER